MEVGEIKNKYYNFSVVRNKSGGNGFSVNCLKKKLKETFGSKCYICCKEFKINSLQLEHKIPVKIAGKIFDIDNLGLACFKCHKEKTIIDKRVINSFKNLLILEKSNTLFLDPSQVHELYKQLSKICKYCLEVKNNFYEDSSNQIVYNENRRIL